MWVDILPHWSSPVQIYFSPFHLKNHLIQQTPTPFNGSCWSTPYSQLSPLFICHFIFNSNWSQYTKFHLWNQPEVIMMIWEPPFCTYVAFQITKYKHTAPFQYSMDCSHLNMTKVKKNRVIWASIINLDNERTWISPTTSLHSKIANYKGVPVDTLAQDLFTIKDGWNWKNTSTIVLLIKEEWDMNASLNKGLANYSRNWNTKTNSSNDYSYWNSRHTDRSCWRTTQRAHQQRPCPSPLMLQVNKELQKWGIWNKTLQISYNRTYNINVSLR